MGKPLGALYLEDEPDFAEMVRDILRAEGISTNMVVVGTYTEFVNRLTNEKFDLIFSDYQLPSCNGLQAIQAAKEKAPNTPLLLVSGTIGEAVAVECLKAGATDYVLKTAMHRLVPAVRRALDESQERQRADAELKKAQAELIQASRMAGMAEVATSVLHNVGNVLNSVNISVSLVSDELKKRKIGHIARVAALMREHADQLGDYLTNDPKGKQVPSFLTQVAEHLENEQAVLLREMEQIRKNIDHIKEIVAIQQSYAHVAGSSETVRITELVEDALRMNAGSLTRHHVAVVRDYPEIAPEIRVEKHKVLQVLINLIRNAKYACDESDRADKQITLRVGTIPGWLKIAVADNGIGIRPEHFLKLFTHGFTTRKDGHGFGLHSGAQAAKEMGGTLRAESDGPGKGAIFTLELPFKIPVAES